MIIPKTTLPGVGNRWSNAAQVKTIKKGKSTCALKRHTPRSDRMPVASRRARFVPSAKRLAATRRESTA